MRRSDFVLYDHAVKLILTVFFWFVVVVLNGQAPIRIMPLGNSITYGNYHPELRPAGLITGYRQSLWLMLTEAGYNVDFVGNVKAGQDAVPAFDPDNEGHPGWTDDQIAVNVYKWLQQTPADVIMLHIGTNGLNPDPSDVEDILDEIDRYENNYGRHIKVIMAKIINRSTYSQLTTKFNFNIEKMAYDRIKTKGDDLQVIDMEFESGINYDLITHEGEMYDNLHPYFGGHEKMAVRWFEVLQEVLPRPDQRPYFISEPNGVTVKGNLYRYAAEAGGSPLPAFTLKESPGGMILDGESGVITWTPLVTGEYWVTVLAENTFGVDSQKFEIKVRDTDSRVVEGLLVLYDFAEGQGNLIHDVSGVGLPLDLYINYEGNVIWDPEQGLEITSDAILTASGNNTKVFDSCTYGNEISVELWLRTGNIEQGGPAHILTVSDPLSGGITISQDFEYTDSARYFFSRHLRTTATNPDGTPVFSSAERYSKLRLQHVVYARSAEGEERFFINGELVGSGITTGTFKPWESTFDLSLCNGFGFNHPWRGKLFLTALYNRALTDAEILQNYNAGYLYGGIVVPGMPEAPGALSSNALSSVAARLTWEGDLTGITGYILERKEGYGLYHYRDMVPAGENEYTDAGLEANTIYSYRIKSVNNFGESAYSNETTVKTFKNDFLTNVALYKSATQSSTLYEGVASRAVDGNTDGAYFHESVTHTAYELNAWWQVDLGDVYNINYIEVWNRTDMCCKDRMARFYVIASEVPFESYDLQTTLNQPGVWYEYHENYPEPMVTFNVSHKGRYIRLQLSDSQQICLAELIAMGSQRLSSPIFTTTPLGEVDEDTPFHYIFSASDTDGDSIVYSITDKTSWLFFDPVLGTLGGTPTNSDVGICNVVLSAYDGLYYTEQSFSIRVKNVNDLPVISTEPDTTARVGELYTYHVMATDEDLGDILSYDIMDKPEWLDCSIEIDGMIMEGTPEKGNEGANSVNIAVSDGLAIVYQDFVIFVDAATNNNIFEDHESIIVYPNPVNDIIFIESEDQGMIRFIIYNVTGETIRDIIFVGNSSNNYPVMINDLHNGLYIYNLLTGSKSITGIFIKE